MATKKRKRTSSGANADGGAIEKGQSRTARDRAGTRAPGGEESLDETERDSSDRQKIRSTITPTPGRPRRD